MRAAREMGIRTVAVYSDADAKSMHVALADEAVHIGPPEASSSYLVADKIIGAATETGADAIHPGYGFLSERAEFSEACRQSGIAFVGPSPEAMRMLGAKIDAKGLAVQAGVPITPGYFERDASDEDLQRAAADIGFPVMLKASAGGGGRGMRIVRRAEDMASETTMARDEALKGFGDDSMMVEKLIENPRHIEVQVLADSHGNVACLFERECSIQRRHQKLIEEAASPVLAAKPSLWEPLKDSVGKLMLAAGYVGAGTAEFMFDEESESFYFLEVNARLQVEHPVTELVTGVDLVQEQLRIAAGEPMSIDQELIDGNRSRLNGHAIEARIVAEDPAAGFLPSIGKITAWAEPKMPGVRVDTGYGPGSEISRHYDSLIAKLIVHADTRDAAIRRMQEALVDFHILGVKTNVPFLLEVVSHPMFKLGHFDTGFLGREFAGWQPPTDVPLELGLLISRAGTTPRSNGEARPALLGPWAESDSFRNARA